MLDNAISRSSDGFYRVTKDMNRYWGTVDEVERGSKKLRRVRCWESCATNWIFATFACCRSSATMYVGAPEDVSETDIMMREELRSYISDYVQRTDDQISSSLSQVEARSLDPSSTKRIILTSPNASPVPPRQPWVPSHVNLEYHLLGLRPNWTGHN